ncbi:hypothetical protein [Meiothermus sp.]|jgi:hypothetical protein|uniref:hypothetical protein n=1 Tax=Meiothermus sp. TaxID=1955249 RepID=UPI0021DC6184|nr:hypothetical protein [Meiothermus sp.]GIW24282.1 MAG: hypothetical protein KatS3mg069_0549 [Meiothermus sp.]
MQKIAVLVLAGTETHEGLGRLVNALMLAQELKQSGDEARLIFDGAGTQGLAALANANHKAHTLLLSVKDQILGACAYCSRAFGVKETLEAAGFPFLSEYKDHPSIRRMLEEGYTVVTF